ncbi:YbjN domain-containing protein [Brevibacterium litoralis]|uniref:YbjN domain-containing protein n=1 Tax=Brevibacterium litoralis TaxID=3138935 RepID=UPI0032EEBD30
MTDTMRTTETGEPVPAGADTGIELREATALVVGWAREQDLEVEVFDPAHVAVTLPGEHKLKTTVSVRAGERAVDLQAFVIRRPDENDGKFHTWLLQRNTRLSGLAFALDPLGDVYLNGTVPNAAWDSELLDQMMGRFLSAADESFDELLVIGFLTSMKKEWAWRIARGESTRNLQAFEHLLAEDNEYIGTY